MGEEAGEVALSEEGWGTGPLPGLLPPCLYCWGQSALARKRRAVAQQGQWGYSGTGDEGERDSVPLPRGPPAFMTSWLGPAQLCLTP